LFYHPPPGIAGIIITTTTIIIAEIGVTNLFKLRFNMDERIVSRIYSHLLNKQRTFLSYKLQASSGKLLLIGLLDLKQAMFIRHIISWLAA
jgi:hypothetical protein